MKLGGPGAAEHPLPRPVESGRGPKGTEGSQAAHSRVFISGDHTALTNLSRNIQVLPVHSFMALKPTEIYMQMRCSPPALGNLPRQPLLLPPSSSSFMGNHQSSHSTGGGEFPCMSCIKMALHTAVLPRAKGFCSQPLVGSLVPFPAY